MVGSTNGFARVRDDASHRRVNQEAMSGPAFFQT